MPLRESRPLLKETTAITLSRARIDFVSNNFGLLSVNIREVHGILEEVKSTGLSLKIERSMKSGKFLVYGLGQILTILPNLPQIFLFFLLGFVSTCSFDRPD